MRTTGAPEPVAGLGSEPQWYKDAVLYELRVGAFQDSDGDGIGDFRGLTERLDYLQDLGVTALWLLPFYPSPLRDDGYDIADYENVHPDCGTIDDFKVFLREAHRRGLRVITELVINHTSDQHPWFQRARRAPAGSRWRDFYVWSDTPERYQDARVIFKDFEPSNWSWDPIAKAYYWHRFYAHQPDLNFESRDVRRAVLRALDFWFGMGVDGLRLDAIPYLFEKDGTNCENLPETHAFLRELRRHVDLRYQDRMLLAEANQWPEDAVAYFGQGDECHMAFHFPVMPRLFMAIHMEDRFPIIDILQQTPTPPESCQWALFLRNHDELTLEMVTDEERDYMYRVYAHDSRARINLGIRRRLAPLIGNDRRRMELLNALLLSLPGTPVIYYGDEIGMGDNIYLGDRNGVRTPMQWSADRNAGFSRANPQRLYLPIIIDPEYNYESINVEAQQNNLHSLLRWLKRLLVLRKRHKAFGRGTIEFLTPSNSKVLAFIRRHGDERLLIVANLSRFVEYVELDLSAFRGLVPIELFGQHPFPPVGDAPYLLTFGPHSFYWFELAADPRTRGTATVAPAAPSVVHIKGEWERLFRPEGKATLEHALQIALPKQRWFGGKAVAIKAVCVLDAIPIPVGETTGWVTLVRVDPVHGEAATYAVPLLFYGGEQAVALRRDQPQAVYAEVEVDARDGGANGVLADALEDPWFAAALLEGIERRRRWNGTGGQLAATRTRAFRNLLPEGETAAPVPLHTDQSNTSIRFGQRLVLKLIRRLAEGVSPDLEIGRFLTERARFPHIPPVAGALEYHVAKREPVTVAALQGFVANEGDAWHYTLDQVDQYIERVLVRSEPPEAVPVPTGSLLDLTEGEPPPLVAELLGGYVETARLLGRRVAELHRALASDAEHPAFAPEPFGLLHQRSIYQSMRNLTARTFRLLRDRVATLPAEVVPDATRLARLESQVLEACRRIVGERLGGRCIRCHGDLHLGQVLRTGNDFVIIDFEGEPARPLGERRVKRSPLRDAAGMLRSFDYATQAALRTAPERGIVQATDLPRIERWVRFWARWTSSSFLRAYLHQLAGSGLIPAGRREIAMLLRFLLLEKAVYELGYELNNRPTWVAVPVRGVLGLLEGQE
jgi:maltose alpha-D-glucosyltransferase/alpha-amylase